MASHPQFMAVYRLVVFERLRRPEFSRWIHETRRRPAVQMVATILQRHAEELRLTDFQQGAEQFMSLTLDVAIRRGAFGVDMTPGRVEQHLSDAVDLFLNGARRNRKAEGSARWGKTKTARK